MTSRYLAPDGRSGGRRRSRCSLADPAGAAPAQAPRRADAEQGRHRLDADVATVLVLLMTVPGLALFYGGLVRTKNMLSVLMQVFTIVCLVVHHLGDLRLQPGLHHGGALNAFVGGFSKAFLHGVTPESTCGDLLERRRHPGVRLHLLPDDLRLHHAGADRRRLRRAHEVLGADAVHRRCG